MNFKELLDKYKDGTLDEKNRALVEAELKKNEAINEYLADEIEKEFQFSMDESEEGAAENYNKRIKKAVDQKFRKTVLISICAVFLMMFLSKYLLSPIVSSFYYNPNSTSVSKVPGNSFKNNIRIDLAVYTELYRPGYRLGSVYSIDNGYGNYDLIVEDYNLFTQKTQRHSNINLKRNKLTGFFDFLHNRDYHISTMIDSSGPLAEKFHSDETADIIESLKKLPKTSYISAFVTFKDYLTMHEIHELSSNYRNTVSNDKFELAWVGIDVGDYTGAHIVGFNPNSRGPENIDKEKYPTLFMTDLFLSEDTRWKETTIETGYEDHFKSMLKYLYDRKTFAKAFGVKYKPREFYKNTLDYVEENGVKSYGVVVFGTVDNILEFMDTEEIQYIYLNDVQLLHTY